MAKNYKRYWVFLVCSLFFSIATAFGQNVSISGTVKERFTGEPIAGATVVDIQTNKGTTSNANGEFQLQIAHGSTIFIEFLGYERAEIEVGNRDYFEIELSESTADLEEVVVIGYGQISRKDVTSSITTINADEMNMGVYSNAVEALQSRVPGLVLTSDSNPNTSPTITLRGSSSLRTGDAMSPYYVIDGIPGASISLISPSDIESIDVLRDASATAIYGSKAANGVIIITTKRGAAGNTNISYNGYIAFDKVAKNWDVMDAEQWRDYVSAAGKTPFAADDMGVDTNWQEEVQRTGVSHNHNVSISGGSATTTYNASINYFDTDGVIKGTDRERLSARSFLESKAMNDKLRIAMSLNISQTIQNNVQSGTHGVYDAMSYYLPISSVYDEDGDYFENLGRSQYYNPVALIEENITENISKELMGSIKLDYEIIDGLNYTLSTSYENGQSSRNIYYAQGSTLATDMDGQAIRRTYESKATVLETYLNYNRTYAERHKLGLMAGYSWEENSSGDGFQVTVSGFDGDELTYNNLGAASNVDVDGFGSTYLSTLRMISFFGRINYSYDDRYLLQATLRQDGSSAFGVNNRWATFPSASAAWRISQEAFMEDNDIFYDLKLRVGYGVSGNSLGFDAFTATELYDASGWYENSAGETVHTLSAVRNANPDLKWETTDMFNLGVDFAFLQGRLGGTVEYYTKTTRDLINTVSVSTTQYVYGSLTTNVGSVNNKGVEFSLYATPVSNKNFRWNTTFNISHNQNRVVELSNSEFTVDYIDKATLGASGQTGAYQQRIMEGYAIGTFYTWKWAGYNEDGVSTFYVFDPETGEATGETTTTPSTTDRTITGCAQPKATLGWSNDLTYKKFSLGLQFQGTFGNDIMNASRAYLSNVGFVEERNVLASVVDTELVTDYNAHYLSDRYIEDGSYLRLSALSLGYNFGAISDSVKGLNVYFNCNNVFTLTGYSGIDPEVTLGGLEPGIDNRSSYPDTRTFMIGATITF